MLFATLFAWGAITQQSTPISPGAKVPAARPVKPLVVIGPKLVRMLSVAERKLAKCQADRGAWTVSVKAVEMRASGSDVDELYGSIYVSANAAQEYHNTARIAGGAPNTIWSSVANQDIGANGATGLSTVTTNKAGYVESFSGGRTTTGDYVKVHFNVYDEDDGRGGPNDERFIVDEKVPAENATLIPTPMPSCEVSPEHVGETRRLLLARSNGNNLITLRLIVRWSRTYPL